MKTKYPIDKELVKYRNMHLPDNRFLIAAINSFLSFLPAKVNKKQVEYTEWKLGDMTMHMFTPLALKDKVAPCLLYFHGGGLIFKATEIQYHNEEQYALNCGCRVIGIDYHLMPKYTCPVAFNDGVEAYKYIAANADSLKIQLDNIAIGGDSAGGLMSLETFLRLKELNIVQPKGMMLIYPVVDNTCSTESVQKFTDTPIWDGRANKLFWKKFLNGQDYISPLQRANEIIIKNLFIEVEEFDCLHDEGKLLYEKVSQNIPNAILLDNPGTFHAYDGNYDATVTKKSIQARFDFIRNCFM